MVKEILITNSTFKNNTVSASNAMAKGGAIYISSNLDVSEFPEVEVSNSRFSKNIATANNGGSQGGAIYVGGPFIMSGSVLDSNYARTDGGGIYINQPTFNSFGQSQQAVSYTHLTLPTKA